MYINYSLVFDYELYIGFCPNTAASTGTGLDTPSCGYSLGTVSYKTSHTATCA